MDAAVLFTGIPVTEFPSSLQWYERFFGRAADVVAHEHEVLWHVTDGGWLYIVRDPARAGSSIAALVVTDIEATSSQLEARGVTVGPIEPEGDAGRKAVVQDPDGNSIALIEVARAT